MSLAEERKQKQDALQTKAFARWVALNIKNAQVPEQYAQYQTELEQNFDEWFKDGVLLCILAEYLTRIRAKYSAKVNTEVFQTQNLQLALNTFATDGVELVNIHSATLNKGDQKNTLGLIWQLIQHYTIASQFQQDDANNNKDDAETITPIVATTEDTKPQEPRSPSKVIPKKRGGANTISLVDVKNHIIEFVNQQISSLPQATRDQINTYTQSTAEDLTCKNLDQQWKSPALLMGVIIALYCANDVEFADNHAQFITTKLTTQDGTTADQGQLYDDLMVFAKDNMAIPKLMDGHDLVESVDVNTNVTYLTYYLAYQYKPKVVEKPVVEQPVVIPAQEPEKPVVVEEKKVEETPEEEKKQEEEEEKKQEPEPQQQQEQPQPQQSTTDFTIPSDENALLKKENQILAAGGDQQDKIAALIKEIEGSDANLTKTSNDKVNTIVEQQKQRNKEHIARLQQLAKVLQAKAAEKPAEQQQQNQQQQQQQPDLNLYLIIALVVAILAFLLK